MKHIAALAGLLGAGYLALNAAKGANTGRGKAREVLQTLTGYNIDRGTLALEDAAAGIVLVTGLGASFIAAKTGVNRYTPKGINI